MNTPPRPPSRPSTLSRLPFAIAIALAGLQAVAAVRAEADEAAPTLRFDIPAQNLTSALGAFTAQSHVQVLYQGSAAQGLRTAPLHGVYSKDKALQTLLAGTPLQPRFTGDRTVTLEAKAPTPAPAPRPAAPLNLNQGPTTLPTVVVSDQVGSAGNDPAGYTVRQSTAATKTDTPLIDTPISVQVVTRQVMEDQQAIKLEDAVRNVSGVQHVGSLGDEGGLYDNFVIRGFDSQFSNFRNGIRQPNFSFEPANIQQVEVLKGPAAILYGRLEPGGLINFATRQPQAQAHYSLQQQFGSYDLYRTTLDATGPLNDDKSLLYRFDLAYLDKGSFRDFGGKDRIFIAPSLTWQISDWTQVNLNLEYQHDDMVDDPGIPALNGSNRPAPVPLSRFYGEPGFRTKQDRKLIELAWSHAFNENWSIRQRFQASLTDYDSNNVWTAFVDADNRTLQRGYWRVKQERDTYGMNFDVLGHFDTFGAKHEVLVGMDFFRFEQTSVGFADSFGYGPVGPTAPPIDIFNPVYGLAVPPVGNDLYFINRQDWVGLYFQDQINFFDTVHFLFGGRHDWATAGNGGAGEAWTGAPGGSVAEAVADYKNNRVDAEKFTPRLGLVYKPADFVSLYANYVESFGLSNARTDGLPLPPQTARQYEGGIKTDFWNGRLTSTLAFFLIYKDNIATTDLATGFRRAIGEARSSGIELDASGRLTDDWSLTLAYALTDTTITKDNDGLQGNKLPNVGKHSANVWTKYLFHDGPLEGFSIGTGVYMVSERQANPTNDLQLPGYVRWDASVGYRMKLGPTQLSTQFNVYNLLDQRFYKSNDWVDSNFDARTNIVPGAPLTFMGSVQLEY